LVTRGRTVNELVDVLKRDRYHRGHGLCDASFAKGVPVSTAAVALDAVFAALANERRREIVAHLAHGSMTTPEIGLVFGFTKQALNRHVSLLEHAGIVKRTLHGRVHELELVPRRLESVTRWVEQLRRGWAASLDRLEEVLRGND
jgi:DNA-binding transcriptional ArsR family regulator